MYPKFKQIDSEFIGDNYTIYGNNDLLVFANFNTDSVRIAKSIGFDRWSNSNISTSKIPYTKDDYIEFEKLIVKLSSPCNIPNHKKLTLS